MRLAGISGSLREQSYNSALLRAAQRLMPEGSTLEIVSIREFVLFDADLEKHGVPAPVARAKEQVMAADGLILATPEYNGAMSGVLKNALDWLSRPPPPQAGALRHKDVALMGVTPGGLGTALAQTSWLPVLRALRMRLWVGGGPLTVSRAGPDMFDGDGHLLDEKLSGRLADYLRGFVESLGN